MSHFLYKKSSKSSKSSNKYDIYNDTNPKRTIPIKYATFKDVQNTIQKLEKLYKAKKYTHRHISQVALIIRVRLSILQKKNSKLKDINKRLKFAEKYATFLKKRTKVKGDDRYKLIFKS